MLYGSLFLLCGTALLAVMYGLVVRATDRVVFKGQDSVIGVSRSTGDVPEPDPSLQQLPDGLTPPQAQAQVRRIEELTLAQHDAALHEFLIQSAIALAIMAIVSIVLGWVVAGRFLRPLRTITQRARQISATNLHARLALSGPRDELKELGDTFDDLLGRLDASFRSQRQFVANASHELRTPLARQRTLIQIGLGDPDATIGSLRAVHERALAANDQQTRLIEALLTLARSDAGLAEREPIDLARLTDQVVFAHESEATRRGIRLSTTLDPAHTNGDPHLVERLVTNLVQNALRHNTTPDRSTGASRGHVEVSTGIFAGRAELSISNTGPIVPESAIDRLVQPFQRLGTDRTHQDGGAGLGLSIVHAVAMAHDASLSVRPRPGGGLRATVRFPGPQAEPDMPSTR
jgi:signal transduction histidine kinase